MTSDSLTELDTTRRMSNSAETMTIKNPLIEAKES